MTTIKSFIKRHPVLTYYVLAFTISWGCFLLVIGGPGYIPATAEQFATLMPFVGPAMLAGPTLASLLLIGIVEGMAGYRELLARLLRWRVGARWYAIALLTAPFLYLTVLLVLALFSPEFLPGLFVKSEKASMLLFGIVAGLVVGIFEEVGWTGFATPMLRRRYSLLTTGLIVGLLWAAWHWVGQVWAPGAAGGAFPLAVLLLDPFLFLVGFRVLMVWVYDHTESLLVAILMHMSLTASALILAPPGFAGVAGWPLLTFDLVWAAAVWIIVSAIAVANRGHLSQQEEPPVSIGLPKLTHADPPLDG